MADVFSGLDEAFGSEFDAGSKQMTESFTRPNEDDMNEVIEQRKKDVSKFVKEHLKDLDGFAPEDLILIKDSIMQLMAGNTNMLERLEKDYFIAPANRVAEVYGMLSSAQTGLIKTMIELNRELINKQKVKSSINTGGGDVTIINNQFTAKDLQKMFSEAKQADLTEDINNANAAE